MIGNEIISHIKHIQEAARQNRLVVFVGAGASASAGVPTWSTLINEIKNELPLDVIKNETDYLKIAQLYKEQRGEKEFLERIQDILRVNTVAPSLIHDAIINLNPCHIITTNYDNLLEQAILRNNKRFHIVRHDEDMPYNHGERMLIKMHGDFESRRIVLTENDYYDYELNYPLIRSFIISLFASKLVLFVGFSFNDSNIKYILRWVEQALHGHMQRVYWLADRNLTNLEATYYSNKNIQTLYIDPQEVVLQNKIYQEEQSENLLKRLRVLSNDYRQNNDSVISLSLDYFHKYTDQIVVFGNSLRNFLPAKERRNIYISDLGDITLPKIYLDKFKEQIEKISISKNEYGDFTREDIHYLLALLRLNSIYEIDDLELPNVNPNWQNEQTNPMDNFFKGDYCGLEAEIKRLKSSPLTYTREDIILPFILYKIGKYDEAYLRYAELAKEMLLHERHILYFICMCNIRAILCTFLNTSSTVLSFDEILDELNNLNIEQILASLPLDEDIKETLKECASINTPHKYIKSIDLKEKLAIQRKQSELGGKSFNSNISVLMNDFGRLFNMGIENYIIQDYDRYCEKFYYNIAEGLIDSLLTIDKDGHSQSKLDELYTSCVYLVIFIIPNKELCKIFNAHDAKEISADVDFKEQLRIICENISKYIRRPNHYNDFVNKKITADYIKNIILLCNFLNTPPKLKDVYLLIVYYWKEGDFKEWTGYLRAFLNCQKPTADEAKKLLEVLFAEKPRLNNHNTYDYYIADIARIAADGNKILTKFVVNYSDKSAIILASLLLVTSKNLKKDIIRSILEKKDLCEIIEAEYVTRARFLTVEMLNTYDIIVPQREEQWVEEYTCNKLFALSQDQNYSYLESGISDFKQKHPCYTFYENPLEFADTNAIKVTWLFFCPDVDLKELLRNDKIMKKVKTYCETHKWNEGFRKRIWDVL